MLDNASSVSFFNVLGDIAIANLKLHFKKNSTTTKKPKDSSKHICSLCVQSTTLKTHPLAMCTKCNLLKPVFKTCFLFILSVDQF